MNNFNFYLESEIFQSSCRKRTILIDKKSMMGSRISAGTQCQSSVETASQRAFSAFENAQTKIEIVQTKTKLAERKRFTSLCIPVHHNVECLN